MIELPKKAKNGKPRISYSQYNLYNSIKSFNLDKEGFHEYIICYFMGYHFRDLGWGEFGHDVEAYVTKKEREHKFSNEEIKTLDKVEVLGELSDSFELDFGDFILTGIIDDRKKDWSKIRDYKTASKNSKKRYYSPDYKQLKFYAMKGLEVTGEIPELEVLCIERKGNCTFSKDRRDLTVGENIWSIPIETSINELSELEEDLRRTVHEISDLYKVFKKVNG